MKLDKILNIDTSELHRIDIGDEAKDITLYEMSRWVALIRGIEVIDKKAHQLKINLDNDKSWVKPLALQKYIDEETPGTIADIKNLLNSNDS
jgi:hypothetical protein